MPHAGRQGQAAVLVAFTVKAGTAHGPLTRMRASIPDSHLAILDNCLLTPNALRAAKAGLQKVSKRSRLAAETASAREGLTGSKGSKVGNEDREESTTTGSSGENGDGSGELLLTLEGWPEPEGVGPREGEERDYHKISTVHAIRPFIPAHRRRRIRQCYYVPGSLYLMLAVPLRG